VPRRRASDPTPERLIGSRITALRKRRAMTQVELAAALGMDQSLLSRYERGALRLHGALVADLARVLHASADELLGLDPGTTHTPPPERRVVRRLQDIERLPRRKKEILLSTIDAFLRGAAAAD
jgi:transcriptional regulator with XRE-family HTH domain